MKSLDKFKYFIKEKLSPVLKKRGFKKSGLTWNKNCQEFIQVINIQRSKYYDPELIDITLNMGIFYTPVFEIVWDKTAPKIAKEVDCLLRTRIGPVLMNDFSGKTKDQWWRIEPNTDVDRIALEFLNNLESTVMPFLDSFTDLYKIKEFLNNFKDWQSKMPQHHLNLAIVAYQMGKKSDAEKILTEVIRKYDPWKERCLVAAKNMGIKIEL